MDVDQSDLPTGNWTLTTPPEPRRVTLQASQEINTVDFGYIIVPDLVVDKYFVTPPNRTVLVVGETVTFDVVITNTGGSTIVYLPLEDQFDNRCLVYNFPNRLPGWYLVIETQPAGLQDTTPNVLPVVLIIVGPGGQSTDNDYGEILYVRLGDFVYVDTNGNGHQEISETIGLTGVPLTLVGVDILGQNVNQAFTSFNGSYLGQGLLPGTYTVTAPLLFGGYHRTSSGSMTTTLTISKVEDLTLDSGCYVYPTGVGVQAFTATAGRDRVTLGWQVFGEVAPVFHV